MFFACTASAAAERPNVVVVLADDMGYGDVHALNPESRIPTPNMDRLAAEGMTFTDAHTPSAVCTPTRYGLLTGRYCWRSPLKLGVLNGYSMPLFERDRPTIASFLEQHGYHTGIVGKWHLGLDFGGGDAIEDFDYTLPVADGPTTRGFDFGHVIPASLDFPPYVYVRNGAITAFPSITQPAQDFPPFLRKGPRSPDLVMENCLDDLLTEAVGYISARAQQDEPFFLYFPLTAPHKPTLPHSRFRGTTELGPYGDFVAQVDWTVGEVIKAIDEAGIRENTLLIVTSDNGSYMFRRDDLSERDHVDDETVQAYRADRHRANYIYRGTKADIWEAGHRVPFFVRWAGKIEAGAKSDETICLTDVFATVAELIEKSPAAGAAEDSYSFLPLLTGAESNWTRPPVIHHSAQGMFAIRRGKWKLVLGNGSGGREAPRGEPFGAPYQLFDLESDPEETRDVLAEHQALAQELYAEFRKIAQEEYRAE